MVRHHWAPGPDASRSVMSRQVAASTGPKAPASPGASDNRSQVARGTVKLIDPIIPAVHAWSRAELGRLPPAGWRVLGSRPVSKAVKAAALTWSRSPAAPASLRACAIAVLLL